MIYTGGNSGWKVWKVLYIKYIIGNHGFLGRAS